MSILGAKSSAKAQVLWEHIDGKLTPINSLTRKPIAWAPQPGSAEIFMACTIPEVLFTGPRGTGKGLPVNEPVWIPFGQVPIGTLKIGTMVCCPDGTKSKVIGIYPQGERQTFEIEFDDGAVARCDDQHIWPIHVQGMKTKRTAHSYSLRPMSDVLDKFNRGIKLHVPTLDALGTTTAARLLKWPVKPYLLGLLLGDGSMSQEQGVRYCTVDEELADTVTRYGAKEGKPDSRNGLRNFRFSAKGSVYYGLRKLKLFGKTAREKFVPRLYLNGNAKVRLALLQGLMDTDGTVDTFGGISFCSASQRLAKDVQNLVWSLGGKATVSHKASVDAYIVYIQPGNKFSCFRLKRKCDRVKRYMHKILWRRIVRITPLDKQETVCIKIDHPLGLFVTRDYTVTHNTDCFLMDFAQHCERGFGQEWHGVIFRRTYPELDDIIGKSRKWFPRIFGDRVKYNAGQSTWVWKSGERLRFRHFFDRNDYDHYHGSNIPWIGWEELTTWPALDGYLSMFSCNRSTCNGLPLKIRATTNPYGVGFNAVKRRFRLPVPPGKILGEYITDSKAPDGSNEGPRIAINSSLAENRMLLEADPGYVQRIRTSAANPAQADAWVNGSWDIVAGGLFDDVWEPETHVLHALKTCPIRRFPRGWRFTRSYDHGQSHPFSVGWWGESDGTPFEFEGRSYGHVRGDMFRLAEWYGCTSDDDNKGLRMPATAIAQGIRERENDWGIAGRVEPGPADSAIFNGAESDRTITVANDMQQEGVNWIRADKGPNSRPQGWQQIRKYLTAAKTDESGYRERPGLFVLPRCIHFIRLLPAMPRDDKNLDDCPKNACDHIGDETRYMLRHVVSEATSWSWK